MSQMINGGSLGANGGFRGGGGTTGCGELP